ncbi:MAG: hypothetical protein BRC44_05780 [Cyanobacteria bacterium QS_4_48_99]|nr:MAG: hypothetical protein BRC44_05780 [Cyanobacteria bacterium QS_4_48_99]PSO97075.1 MAG: hypothetical protein BRC48_05055 [Cyanobacteria bacterium QS_9_48_30]
MSLTQQFAKQMLPSFADGRLKPVVNRSFKLEEVAQPHSHIENHSNFGKIILTI